MSETPRTREIPHPGRAPSTDTAPGTNIGAPCAGRTRRITGEAPRTGGIA